MVVEDGVLNPDLWKRLNTGFWKDGEVPMPNGSRWILLLAGNERQAYFWWHTVCPPEDKNRVKFIRHVRHLQIDSPFELVLWGTWEERHDLEEIYQVLLELQAKTGMAATGYWPLSGSLCQPGTV